MIDPFLDRLFAERFYSFDVLLVYIFAGIMAGLTRLIIRNQNHFHLRVWWNDGSLIGALIISVVGAILIDSNFVWSFLGGYFIVYILTYIQRGLEKITKTAQDVTKKLVEDDTTKPNDK